LYSQSRISSPSFETCLKGMFSFFDNFHFHFQLIFLPDFQSDILTDYFFFRHEPISSHKLNNWPETHINFSPQIFQKRFTKTRKSCRFAKFAKFATLHLQGFLFWKAFQKLTQFYVIKAHYFKPNWIQMNKLHLCREVSIFDQKFSLSHLIWFITNDSTHFVYVH
jgi:hypothetical protein